MGTGLDNYYPFKNTPAAHIIIKNADSILAPGTDQLGWRHSNVLWALMSNVLILDRLSATFGAAAVAPSHPVPRAHCDQSAIGTAAQVSIPIIMLPILCHFKISS
jgi:hypothetical protein